MNGSPPVGVRLSNAAPLQFCDPGQLDLSPGDLVTAQTGSEEVSGQVVVAPGQVVAMEVGVPLAPLRLVRAQHLPADPTPTDGQRLLDELGPL